MNYFKIAVFALALSACESPSSDNRTPASTVENSPITAATPTESAPSPSASPTPVAITTPTPTPSSGPVHLNVVIRSATGYSSSGLALLEKARSLLEIAVNSDAFKQKVLSFTYQGKQTYVQNNGLNNQQIYDLIMSGAEKYPSQTAANNTMDLYSALYTSSWFGRNTIGYTTISTQTVYMNTYFFNYATAAEVADNLMHEWLHKVGFDHDSSATARRPSSVPYAIGYIAEDIVKTLL